MPTLIRALVKPELLIWARESARLSVEQAAQKAQVKPASRLAAWERGESQPTIGQLRKLGRVYKRPLAVFYLSKAPKTFQAMQDFRRLPEGMAGAQSPELAFEVRRARYRREIALDLHEELFGAPPAFTATASLDEDPEAVGVRMRQLLGIGRDEPTTWRSSYEALNRWRSALEQLGVLVFQASDVEVAEVRGFSISQTPLPVVVVNLKDVPLARVFTMLHEATHLMLREGGLCDLDEEQASPAHRRMEVFCNRVAGAALIPKDWLLEEEAVRKQKGVEWPDEVIATLAHRYRASREVVIRRLLILGRTTEAFYRKKREELQAEFEAQREEALRKKALGLARKGFVTPDRMAVSTAGPFFVRLVLSSYHQEKITSNDLSSFLEVRLKHVPKIERAVLQRSVAAGAPA
jgi:Zn-dependent peptidase ImmA (M78 family)/transcriptional regulator with XRE-family HTH domain